jgi:hypothetical protein
MGWSLRYKAACMNAAGLGITMSCKGNFQKDVVGAVTSPVRRNRGARADIHGRRIRPAVLPFERIPCARADCANKGAVKHTAFLWMPESLFH